MTHRTGHNLVIQQVRTSQAGDGYINYIQNKRKQYWEIISYDETCHQSGPLNGSVIMQTSTMIPVKL